MFTMFFLNTFLNNKIIESSSSIFQKLIDLHSCRLFKCDVLSSDLPALSLLINNILQKTVQRALLTFFRERGRSTQKLI